MKYWDKAWSLVSQCTPVSAACDNCWLRAMDTRFGKTWDGNVCAKEDRLDLPLKTKKPTVFSVWSDLFHEKVSFNFVDRAFEIINLCCQHTFLICTKRPERMAEYFNREENFKFLAQTHKIFLGTTVENQEMANKRIPELLKCKPFKLFLSIEPMLSAIIIPQEQLRQISICIAGCESGHHARETKIDFFRNLREQCIAANVPLFIKQLKENGKMGYNHPLSTIKKEELWNDKI